VCVPLTESNAEFNQFLEDDAATVAASFGFDEITDVVSILYFIYYLVYDFT